jgi:hypothetical protein
VRTIDLLYKFQLVDKLSQPGFDHPAPFQVLLLVVRRSDYLQVVLVSMKKVVLFEEYWPSILAKHDSVGNVSSLPKLERRNSLC